MKPINEDEAEVLIEEHLRQRGWDVTDFTVTRKRWLDLEEEIKTDLQELPTLVSSASPTEAN